MEQASTLKTGTTTVGILCKDGVILAADRRATMGNFIADKKAKKIDIISDNLALTTAGTVSDIQLIGKLVKAEIKLKEIRVGRKITVKESANLLAGMIYENIRKYSVIPGISHFILGGSDKTGFHMYDLFVDGSITECDDFVSSGSGSVVAYGVLEAMYKKGLSVKEGTALAVKSVNAALQRDSASGQGIDVIAITEQGIQNVFQKTVNNTVDE